MAGLPNPSKFNSLDGSFICLKEEELQEIERIYLRACKDLKKLHALKGNEVHNPETLIQYAKENLYITLVDDKYLLLVDVYQHWMSPQTILHEELVYKYQEGPAKLSSVLACMEILAEEFGCSKIEVGTSAAHGRGRHEALASAYENAGLEFEYISLRRVINGRS